MDILTGFQSTTPSNFQLGAGVLLRNFDVATKTVSKSDIISATRGGGSFSAVPTVRQVAVDGVPTYTKGLETVDEWVVTLNTTILECTEANLKLALGLGTATQEGKITATNDANDDDYADVWWVGNRKDGAKIAIRVMNAVNLGGLNLTITDKGEGTIAVTFTGHYAQDKLNTAPFEIHVLSA